MFLILTGLFSLPFKNTSLSIPEKRNKFILIGFLALAYGIAIEFVQKYFIPNRSFDVWDILADGLGCIAAIVISNKYFAKVGAKK